MIYPPRIMTMTEVFTQDFDAPEVTRCWNHSLKYRVLVASKASISLCDICAGHQWLIQDDLSNYLIIGRL